MWIDPVVLRRRIQVFPGQFRVAIVSGQQRTKEKCRGHRGFVGMQLLDAVSGILLRFRAQDLRQSRCVVRDQSVLLLGGGLPRLATVSFGNEAGKNADGECGRLHDHGRVVEQQSECR